MKMTLQEKANMLNVQYILEYLIEHYEDADCESERYRIKLLLFDFIKDTEVELSTIVEYMQLDEAKFRPFLDLLSNVSIEDQASYKQSCHSTPAYTSTPTSICYVIRRQL